MRTDPGPFRRRHAAPASAAVIALVAMFGALIGSATLQGFSPSLPPMVPSTGVGLLLASAALVLVDRRPAAARALALAVALIGVLTLAEYLLDRSLGIDFGSVSANGTPGRMGANTSVCFVLFGASLWSLDRGSGLLRPAQLEALAIALIAGLALLGYLFDVTNLQRGFGSSLVTPMALPSALACFALSIGLLIARPQVGLAALALSDGAGGTLVRRLTPPAVLAPVAIAYVRLQGQRAGLYGTEEGLAIYCTSLVVLFGVLIVLTGRTLERLEQARRVGQERERAIVEATGDAIIMVDGGGLVLLFNAAAERIFGRAREEMLGRPLADFIAGGGLPDRFWEPLELTACRADGSQFPAEVTVTPLRQASLVIHVRDITQRVAGERAARRLAALVETSGDAIVVSALDGTITDWNAGAERLYGYHRDEAIGRSLTELIIPPDRQAEMPESRAHLREVGSVNDEVLHVRRDGSTVPVEATASIIHDASGTIAGISLIARDITRRRENELAIRRLATIVESSPDVIYTFETNGSVIVWNAAAERVYGYGADEIVGRSIAVLSDAGEQSRMLESLFARLGRGETVVNEGVAVRKDGGRVEISYTAFPIRDAHGTIVAGGVIARDVTERQKLEAQLRQAQKMEAVGQLAGGIAHDFNNLLTVITGYGGLARALVNGGTGAEELEEIERAAQRAAALTSQLLAFSRRQLLDPVLLDLSEVARGLVPMLDRLIGEDIAVEARLEPELPNVLADAGQLEQVIVNLAVNARDAMPNGGTLTIETRTLYLDEEDGPAHYVCLSVSDTGTGIDREVLPHIFEPFFTTKTVGEGTGLGLASVHGAISQSGGYVRVYSEIGHGTVFKLFLPATTEKAAPLPDPRAGEDRLGGAETILVCEDEDSVRSLVERLLSRAGYRVLSADRPSEALAIVDAEPGRIDGLVSDVIMPDMPGPELARRLQDLRPGLRTLFLSGYTADTVHGRGNLPPGSAFLEKPFDRVTLLRTLRELLDRVAT